MKRNGFVLAMVVICWLGSNLLAQSQSIAAQDSSYIHKSFRVEGGLGFGIAGEGDGISGRLALSYLAHKWGAMARITAFDGGEGTGGWLGPPVESFYDKGILLSRILSSKNATQAIASAGVGWMHGRRLNSQRDDLEDIGPIPGFAFELGIASARSAVGWKLGIMGNLNAQSNLYGIYFALTLGYQK